MLRPLQPDLKENIHKATLHFHNNLPGSPGEEYLASRGIGPGTARAMGLGYVDPEKPLEGWERHAGRISLPYLNMAKAPIWLKFRAVPAVLGPDVDKMSQEAGGGVHLYNTIALSANSDILCLAEGEFDVVTLTALGLPAVGVPGATAWKPWMHRALQGYDRVVLFYDSDKAGRDLVKAIKADMPDLIPIGAPGGYNDIGAAYEAGLGDRIVDLAHGRQDLIRALASGDMDQEPTTTQEEEQDGTEDTEGQQGGSRRDGGGVRTPGEVPGDRTEVTGEGTADPIDGRRPDSGGQGSGTGDGEYEYDPRDEFGF